MNFMTQLLHYAIAKGNKDYYGDSILCRNSVCQNRRMQFRLQHYRKKHGFTQTEVAEKIGISQGLYNQLESGKRRMNETYLDALAQLYKVSPVQLIVDESRADPLFDDLDAAFRLLSRTERRILVDSAKGIASGRVRT